MREYIDAAAFKEMILCADAALHANIQAINDLNVFPVPDGDTGTNMGLTINNAATELRKKDFDTVAAAAECVAGAMLRGARGNSGVILSLLFRGISRRLKGLETAGAAEVEAAWSAEQVEVPEKNIFDTVYVVRKNDPNVDLMPLRLYLDSIGDSLVISDDDEIFKVHVHTDIPGAALTESQKYGALDIAKIENMQLQALDLLGGRKSKSTDDLAAIDEELTAMESATALTGEEPETIAEAEKEYGVVAVCAGKGMEDLFRELGADGIVTGGQTMNPSTDDILREVNRTPANTVFVFPNNKNIIMAAEQCVPLTEKKVIVMPSKTVPQGISALLNFSPDESEESLVGAMGDAMGNVHTAMVTYAARNSDFDGHDIHAGEYLALLDGALVGSYSSLDTLFAELGEACGQFHPEFVTLYYGEDVAEGDAAHASELLGSALGEAEVSVVNGGQPVYYYMIAIE